MKGSKNWVGGWERCGVEWKGDIWWPGAICGDIFTPLLISNARTMCSSSFVTHLLNKPAAVSAAPAAPNVCAYLCAWIVWFNASQTANAESFRRKKIPRSATSQHVRYSFSLFSLLTSTCSLQQHHAQKQAAQNVSCYLGRRICIPTYIKSQRFRLIKARQKPDSYCNWDIESSQGVSINMYAKNVPNETGASPMRRWDLG